jgi:hypothetical protein
LAANTTPIFTSTPKINWASADGDGGSAGPVKTANTNMDGTGTVNTVWTAGANGSYLRKLFCRAAGSCIQSVVRVFINNGSSQATLANNILYTELTLPGTTASANSALQAAEVPFEFAIPASYKILVTIGTTVSAGWWFGVLGGDY